MKYVFVLLFLTFSIGYCFSQDISSKQSQLNSIPLITTYKPSDYNAGIQNWSITQDTSGYLYVANNYGLLEFDGASWNNYPITNATKTRSVLVDKKTNKIFVGGQKQLGFFEHTQSGIKYISLVDHIPDTISKDEIWDIVLFKDTIYANINGTIAWIDREHIVPVQGLNSADFMTIDRDELLVGSKEGLFRLKDQTLSIYKDSHGHNLRGVSKIKEKSYLLFTYDGEVLSYENNVLKEINTPSKAFLRDAKINKVLSLKNNNLVIGTQNNGLLIVNQQMQPILHLTKNKGLNHRTVTALYEDDFENLWVGLNNGICVVELGTPFSLINEAIGLEGTGYAATFQNGKSYFGTSSGLFEPQGSIAQTNEISGYRLIPGSEGLVNNVQSIDDKILLSHHEGAFILSDSGFKQFFNETGVWAFKKKSDDKLIGGTYEGFQIFNQQSNPPLLDKSLTKLNESSRVFEFIDDSTLWMTHGYKGVFKVHLRNDSIYKVDHYGMDKGFPSDILISVYRISDQLIFTAETGIYQYNSITDSFERHPFLNRWFGNRHVSKIKQLHNGDIFYIADGQLGFLKKISIGVYEPMEKQFKKINSYISDDLENVNVSLDEDILIGAKEGFVHYKPRQDNQLTESFNTYLKRVIVTNPDDNTSVISGPFFRSIRMQRPKRIRFEYSAPYYDGLNNLRYSYRLMPYEENWSEWTEVNWKEYTNLPADNYVFEIKSTNIYEMESMISKYPFQIDPEWYETTIAYAAYISFIIFIFSSILLVRERKHKVEKRYINLSKEEEIKSKEREITEFSEKTNQEIQSLKNESLRKEINHKNSQLASVTMHLLSKNEFVMAIRKKIHEVESNSKTENESLQKIVKSIDKNIDEDDAWETFVHHFDQVHGNFLHRLKEEINLTPQETKLCAYLKMNMSTKDIANLMNITVRGVELARYRLRKKLGISRDVNLVSYLDRF